MRIDKTKNGQDQRMKRVKMYLVEKGTSSNAYNKYKQILLKIYFSFNLSYF